MVQLSVIIPAYNEEKLITHTVNETVTWLEQNNSDYEIVLVDDGSQDDSFTIMQRLAQQKDRIHAVTTQQNYGKGFALKFGVAYAQGKNVAFFDADMDIRPEQLGILWEKMDETGADAVVGSKRQLSAESAYPLLRRVISFGFFVMMRLLFGLPLSDTQAGIKLFRRELLMDVMPRLLIKRFAFDLELLNCAHRLGYRIVETPIVIQFARPESRIMWEDIRRVVIDMMAIFYRTRILHYYDD